MSLRYEVNQKYKCHAALPFFNKTYFSLGVSVDIKEGEFITILGTSGGGKTTMLNIMGTIDKPTKGDVFICG